MKLFYAHDTFISGSRRKILPLHSWNLTIEQARKVQEDLAPGLVLRGNCNPRIVAGIDCSYRNDQVGIWAAAVVIDLKDFSILEIGSAFKTTAFPYVSGFLAFREGPVVLEAFSKLKSKVEAVIFDGQGIAHPRRFGIAAHLGLWLDLPTIGCGKTRLCGHADEPDNTPGAFTPLIEKGEQVGVLLRTKENVKPVFISPGHRISMKGAVKVILKSLGRYRLPEPTRIAHLECNRFRRETQQEYVSGGEG